MATRSWHRSWQLSKLRDPRLIDTTCGNFGSAPSAPLPAVARACANASKAYPNPVVSSVLAEVLVLATMVVAPLPSEDMYVTSRVPSYLTREERRAKLRSACN